MAHLTPDASLCERYQSVQRHIVQSLQLAKRQPDACRLLAVSKKHPANAIKDVFELGQRAFAENYVQEGVDKIQALAHLPIEWHFIGPLQSNKSRLVAQHFDWVHTIDRLKIAQRLSDQRPQDLPSLNVLIQINISQQHSKSGISLDELPTLAKHINALENVTLRGLMCIPAPLDDSALQTEFIAMQQAFNELQTQYEHIDTLSMGMSGDLQLAVTCGSTMVRIGTAIFGQRTN